MISDPKSLLDAILGGMTNRGTSIGLPQLPTSAVPARYPRPEWMEGIFGPEQGQSERDLNELPAYDGQWGGEQSLHELPPVSSPARLAAMDSGQFGDYQPPEWQPPEINDADWHNPNIQPVGRAVPMPPKPQSPMGSPYNNEIAQGDSEVAASHGRVDNARRLLDATLRGETPFALNDVPEVSHPYGLDQRTPLNQAAGNQQIDDFLDRRNTAVLERGGAGPDGRRVPMGQMPGNFATTQRLGPPQITELSGAMPSGRIPGRPLETQMQDYSAGRKAQQSRLAARGDAPERIAQLMGGKRPGPDLSVIRAVNEGNLNAGLDPRLAGTLAVDAGGGGGPTNNKLLEALMGGWADPLRSAQARGVDVQTAAQERLNKLPLPGTPEDLKAKQDLVNQARGLGLADAGAQLTPELEAHAINQANTGGVIDPKLAQKFADLHNQRYTGRGDGEGFPFKKYYDREGHFVDTVNRYYASAPVRPSEKVVRKWYRSTNSSGAPLPKPYQEGNSFVVPEQPLW